MLNELKEVGKSLGNEMGRAWSSLSEGWHELLSRGSASLTHFTGSTHESNSADARLKHFPQWGLLASELEETSNEFLVRIELPGLDKEDCEITVEDNTLCVRGEKRISRQSTNSTYHVLERAYGIFQRQITLPRNADSENAQASFDKGVLTVCLPKGPGNERPRKIHVS